MDMAAFTRREGMLKLHEKLLAVREDDRIADHIGVTADEQDIYLENIIGGREHGQ